MSTQKETSYYTLKMNGIPKDAIHHLSDTLIASGALSLTLTDQEDNPIFEPEPDTMPLWPSITLKALYHKQQQAENVSAILHHLYPSFSFTINKVQEIDWENAWKAHFKPMQFGKRLFIYPATLEPKTLPENSVSVVLNPGLAFGTGTHPTTRLCLQWLEQHCAPNKTVIDYGSGSGILGIAAHQLGASKIYAVDIDPQAQTATAQNALNNGILPDVLCVSHPDTLQKPVDLLIANILLTPLISLKERFQILLNPEGYLVVSGILTDQSETLVAAYQTAFDCVEKQVEEDWALLVFQPKASDNERTIR